MSARLRLFLWSAVAALAGGLLLKHFVFDVYRVDSASMEPTIMGSREGGARVLVHYGAFVPRRFDPVVVTRQGEGKPLVKRAAGLPNERVQIVGGDLLIDGRRLGISIPRPAPISVLDTRPGAWSEAFFEESPGSLQRSGAELRLTASGEQAARLLLRGDVHDDFFDEQRGLVRGQQSVNDLLIDAEFELAPGAVAGFELTDQGDLFRVEIARGAEQLECSLIREGEGVLAVQRHPSGRRLRFFNIDDSLCMRIDEHEASVIAGGENKLDPNDVTGAGKHLQPRVRVWVRQGSLLLRSFQLSRDLYYTERGEYARKSALRLGMGECFLLGDNSAVSRDGREWGPTPLETILGHPTHIVWPLERWREFPAPQPLEKAAR